MTIPKMPALAMRVTASGWAICARCEELIGRDLHPDSESVGRMIVLKSARRGEGWVYSNHGYFEYTLRRRRETNPLSGGPVNRYGAEANSGSVVVCPNRKCAARQVVPPR